MIDLLQRGKRYLTASARCLSALWLCALATFLFSPSALAISDRAATPQVQAQLVASVASVYPGAEIYLGVNQKIIPHWYTYWINPGDSGNATTIEWTYSERYYLARTQPFFNGPHYQLRLRK